MDYNDNENEGQNLHLAGEESSKISSVLRPFALPKFDFDDSLHGHLRFDSLVENEVFLGISSQEENQWIEDFSRGGSAIEFSSSATESCALPRRSNVWSEATSSESVEMLLKAVRQEEMVPVGNIEESDKGDLSGRSMESNLGQDDKVDKSDNNNPSLPPAEVEGQCSEVRHFHGEYSLEAIEENYTLHGVGVGYSESRLIRADKNLDVDLKVTADSHGEDHELLNEFGGEKIEKRAPVLDMEIDNTNGSSQDISFSVGDLCQQDKVTDVSLVSEESISEQFEEQKGGLGGNATDNSNRVMNYSFAIPSRTVFLKEEQSVDIHLTNFVEASTNTREGESVFTDGGCDEVALDECAGRSECGAAISSSDSEIKLLSGSGSVLHEETSVSFPEDGCIQGSSMKGSGDITPTVHGIIEQEALVSQPLDEYRCPVAGEGIPGSKSSPEAAQPAAESSALSEVSNHLLEDNKESNIKYAGGPGGGQLVAEDTGDSGGATTEQQKNFVDCDGIHPLQAGSPQTCREDTLLMQENVDQSDRNILYVDRKNLHLDLTDAFCNENERGTISYFTYEGVKAIIQEATVLQSKTSAVDDPVLKTEVEATKPTSSRVGGDELVDGCEENLPSSHNNDHCKETELEACLPNASDLKGSLEVAGEVAPSVDIEKGKLPDSAAAGGERSDERSVSLDDAPGIPVPKTDDKKLNKEMGHPTSDMILQLDSSEPVPTEKPVALETEGSRGADSFIVSVSSSAVESDESNHLSATRVSIVDIRQSQINKKESPKRKDIANVVEVLSPPMSAGGNAYSKEEGTFTFDLRVLGDHSAAVSGQGLQSFSGSQACKPSSIGDGSPTSRRIPKIPLRAKEISQAMPSSAPSSVGSKGPFERKTRRGSSKSGKESVKKGNVVKDASLRPNERGDKSSISLSSMGSGQLTTFESVVKPRGVVSIPTSILPDLNTSMPSSAFFQQPFTDLQQVQLRAQIFVYGSLIQGAAPDEACMVSAFDGGRSVWEPAWRACVERLHGQKPQGLNTDTPVQSCSGVKTPVPTSRQGFHQSEVISSPASRTSNKTNPSLVVNTIIPLSSPLWNVATPSSEGLPSRSTSRSSVFDYQAISPLNPFQTPPVRNFGLHTTSRTSQTPFPVPWVASSHISQFGVNFSAVPTTEPVKLTPANEPCLPSSSGPKHTPVPPIHAGTSAMFGGTSSPADLKKVTVSTSLATAETKSRKRKKSSSGMDAHIPVTASMVDTVSPSVVADHSSKVPALENLSRISLVARSQADSIMNPFVSCHYSTTLAVATPSSFVSKSSVTTSMPSNQLKRVDLNVDKRALNLETSNNVEEAELQAEEAAAHAAAAIGHCHGVWRQLDQQRNSGLTSDAEAKLASAAVAIAAAAAVAKAAAAAAKVASGAAVQAKLMADEAVIKSGSFNTSEYNPIPVSSSINNMANATPVSILKGGDRNTSTLAISAAREAARKRVEAASVATRQAENLDAIVKAAELAAEAVSHAGKIVSMGDPVCLSELVEAGPDGYWKVSDMAYVSGPNSKNNNKSKSTDSNMGKDSNVCLSPPRGEPDKDVQVTTHEASPIRRELSVDNHVTAEENRVASAMHGEKNLMPHKEKRVSASAKSSSLVSAHNSYECTTNIKEGSVVEVLKDTGESKKAWFSATVLSVKNDEIFVCYTELRFDEVSELLKEWVPLDAKDGKAPSVRIAHPITSVQLGTRKRRRSAAKDYAWSVGDRVDAWVQDCWREGIISEKHKKDATTFSVHFEAQDGTLPVKAWHLRPTLIWSDGEWIEWCRPEHGGSSQGDTPQEKRLKLGSMVMEMGKLTKNIDSVEIGSKEETRFPLSANDKVFNIGSTTDENNPNADRTVRSGLQKEGSRVVFGVPKPGKKRKFMEVSKHYVSDRSSKTNVPNDSVKLASLLAAQGAGSRGLKNNAKPDLKKKATASKPKSLRSGKPPIPSRTLPRKDESISLQSNMHDAVASEHVANSSASNNKSASGKQNLNEFRSFSSIEERSGGIMEFSSQALPPESRKKASVRKTRSDRLNQGKLAPASVKSAEVEAHDKVIPEVSEPRRSNRRIQPTSRLLEGLQSSLIISKIPTSAHDKSQRSHREGTSKGNSNRG